MIIYYSSPSNHVRNIVKDMDGEKRELLIKEKVSKYFFINAIKWGKASKQEKEVTFINDEIDLKNLKELTIIGPVWAGKPSNPIQTFIKQNKDELNKIKDLKIILNCEGSDGKSKEFISQYLDNYKYSVITNKK